MAKPSETQIKENRQAWVEALRYGGYTQTSGTLRRPMDGGDYSYCCLGVACNVYQSRTGKGEWELSAGGATSQFTDGEGSLGFAIPPDDVSDYFGLGEYTRLIEGDGEDNVSGWCVVLNDEQRKDFETIADFVDGLS